MKRYFFADNNLSTTDDYDDDYCYPESVFQAYMEEYNLTEIKVFLAVKDTIFTDYFWCKALADFGAKGEGTCGKVCKDYKPRNGKSGICCHYGFTYERGEELILKRKGKK